MFANMSLLLLVLWASLAMGQLPSSSIPTATTTIASQSAALAATTTTIDISIEGKIK
jgi:hypothetical protein